MIHALSLILPKESISRTLLNVYNMETFTPPFHPPCCLLCAASWKTLTDDFAYIVFTILNFQFIVFGGFSCKQQSRKIKRISIKSIFQYLRVTSLQACHVLLRNN